MKLYEIDSAIEQIIFQATDMETGEISDNALTELANLNEQREQKIESILCYIKNLKAFEDALKAEKQNIADKQTRVHKQIDNLSTFIQSYLDGEKFASAKASVSYRTSTSVEITDVDKFITWANLENMDDLLRYKDPEIDKTKVKELLKSGKELEYATLVEKTNMTIK